MSPASVRRSLLFVFAAGALRTGAELVLLGYTEQPWQWVPVVLAFAGPIGPPSPRGCSR